MNKQLSLHNRSAFIILFLTLWLPALVQAAPPRPIAANTGTISGTIVFPENPSSRAGVVSFFLAEGGHPPDMGDSRRVPDIVGRIDRQGKFSTRLPAGTYQMGALQWYKGRRPGPPKGDEKYIFIMDQQRALRTFEIKAGEELKVGELTGATPKSFPSLDKVICISGKVLNEDGKPFENAVVLLKVDMNAPRPLYISDVTGKRGTYSFTVPPGKYYLVARQQINMAGRPRPGSYLGVYGSDEEVGAGGRVLQNSPATPIFGADGDSFADVNITMFKLPEPETKRQEMQERAKAQQPTAVE